MATAKFTFINDASQGQTGGIAELFRDYSWLRVMFETVGADDPQCSALADQMRGSVDAIAGIRSGSIADLKAKVAIVRQEGGQVDNLAIAALDSLTRDLDAWPGTRADISSDAAVETYAAFIALYNAVNDTASRNDADAPADMAQAYFAAYDATQAATATTPAGVAAKLRASVKWYQGSEIEMDALTGPLADLVAIGGEG